MGRVEGKVALVSGGARGMGASHSSLLVREGAKVVIADLLDADGAALAAKLGENATFVHLDVTKPDEWDAAVAHATSTFGSLDVLVNNAGIANGAALHEFTDQMWSTIIGINLTGVFYGMRAAAPALAATGNASIINISSVEGLRGSPGLHGYVAAKFGVRGLTKSVAVELAAAGVRVNSIHPGLIETPMTVGIDATRLQIPLGRAAKPEEVSNLVLFLASDESSYSTGSEFVIDGGLTSHIPEGRTD
ncbi:SDR family oxidoreductase [Herbiconiux ginsengi]|uniref:3alpha(Or 20beta)-hydroxysteroid dehydrogenase n=1 Tax=Herbiconiux ginsengi TaxID=381665 RepID=A0A1H3TWI5_9MICO|nr:glucose 1-dehydrogenase [Herbiconiux ginsengi]SDZ54121.1 3alpha(or 20beta)-hydroxysteroid dehydrogenase [Herbiconiux ginsengi]